MVNLKYYIPKRNIFKIVFMLFEIIIVFTVKLKNHSAFNVVQYSCILCGYSGGRWATWGYYLLPYLQLFTMKYYLIFLLLIIF